METMDLVNRYVSVWNESDAGERRRRIRSLWAENGTTCHRPLDAHGYEAIEERVTGSWDKFLKNHAADLIAVDFFAVPTATYRVLFVLLMLTHRRRRLAHFDVTEHPTERQLLEACPEEEAPRYLIRDRDQVYGQRFRRQATTLDIREAVIAPRAPWQNAYAERVIGSIRRECLDRVVVIGERHLREVLSKYVDYYNRTRTHLSLNERRARASDRAGAEARQGGGGAARLRAPSGIRATGGLTRSDE